MVLDSMMLAAIEALSHAALFGFGVILFRHALLLLPEGAARRRVRMLPELLDACAVPDAVKIALLIGKSNELAELQSLLAGAGIAIAPALFETMRRLLILMALGGLLLGFFGFQNPSLVLFVEPVYVVTASAVLLVWLLAYKIVLQSLKHRRSQRIVQDIYVLSNQLLYYAGSRMNLHAKLFRCLPMTRTIRPALHMLLGEWYQDADAALKRFKWRLGTDEAYGFAETLNSLRLGEHDSYYDLLRERIDDYKQKIDMQKESRKETVSYVLFVLAGLPILNTFRLFMYPWVMEGQKLFQSLN